MTDRLSRAIPGHLDGLFFVPPAASFPAPNCNPAITSRRSSGGTRPEKFCRASLVHVLRYGGSILFSGPGERGVSRASGRGRSRWIDVMVSGDIRDGVPYAKEVRDLAGHAHRLLREESREPSGGNLREHRAMLRRIDSLRRQLAQEGRSDLLRWLERLRQQVEGRRPIPSRSIASR
jgi:hypothetical protein